MPQRMRVALPALPTVKAWDGVCMVSPNLLPGNAACTSCPPGWCLLLDAACCCHQSSDNRCRSIIRAFTKRNRLFCQFFYNHFRHHDVLSRALRAAQETSQPCPGRGCLDHRQYPRRHAQAGRQIADRVGNHAHHRRLAHGGALGIDPNTIVTMRDVLDILELRISLETEAAGLAASRRTEAELAALREALDNFIAIARAGGATVPSDVQFHLLIAQASGNRYFRDILHHLGSNIIPRARLNSAKLSQDEPAAYMERVTHEHEDIFNAIRRQDPESARAAMRIHLSNSRERLRRAQEQIEGKA